MASHDAAGYRTRAGLSSPLQAADSAGDARIGMVMYDDGRGDEPDATAALVWSESVSGRTTLRVRNDPGDAPRLLTPDHAVRGGIGYGGGEFTVARGWAYFVAGERLWKVGVRESICRDSANRRPRPLTPAPLDPEDTSGDGAIRGGAWAAPAVSPDGRWLVAVHEDAQERTRLVVVDTDGLLPPRILHEAPGLDFLMQPRFAPEGTRLVWVGWRDGEMPWDAARLFAAPWLAPDTADATPRLGPARIVDGSAPMPPGVGAVLQPEFLSDGRLVYISDGNETGFGRVVMESSPAGGAGFVGGDVGDVELFQPAWIQETRVMAPLADGTLAVIADRAGVQSIERLDPATGAIAPIGGFSDERCGGGEYGEFATIAASPDGKRIAVVASGPRTPVRLLEWESIAETAPGAAPAAGWVRIAVRTSSELFVTEDLAPMRPVTWPGDDGGTVHGMFWEPRAAGGDADETGRDPNSASPAPLLVTVHGGPTGHVRAGWNAVAQHFATRGWAVLSVNHRGSTGLGRECRDSLRGGWGVVELADIVSGVRRLAERGQIDPQRVAILGGSAGGFTVLNAILRHPDLFAAGVALYPVADLAAGHAAGAVPEPKFERRYFEWLVGAYPESAAVYEQRSPLRCGLPFRRPVALFHGREDRIVPPAHSESIAARLDGDGVPYAFHLYDGESHGFRRRETLDHCYREIDRFLAEHVTR